MPNFVAQLLPGRAGAARADLDRQSLLDAPARTRLAEWIEAASDADELIGRNEAVRRIVLCIEQRDTFIQLDRLALHSLPDLLADMHWLTDLRLSDNRFTDLPAPVRRLPLLRTVDLMNNRISAITDTMLQLPRECSLVLTANLIPPALRTAWETRGAPPGAPDIIFDRPGVPTFAQTAANRLRHNPATPAAPDGAQEEDRFRRLRDHFSLLQILRASGGLHADDIAHFFGHTPNAAQASLADALEHWRNEAGGFGALAGDIPAEELAAIETEQHADAFALWLMRLSQTADYTDPVRRTLLHGRVRRLLGAVRENADLRGLCFAIAHESIETCGDRVALGLNQMEMAHTHVIAEHAGLDAAHLFNMGRAAFRLDRIGHIARRHAQRTDRMHELVEVELAFQVGLRARLQLPIASRGMLYPASAQVLEKDLEEAATEIEAAERLPTRELLRQLDDLNDPTRAADSLLQAPPHHPLAAYLAQHYTPWQQHIAQRFGRSITEHTERMHACLEVLSERIEADALRDRDYQKAADEAMFQANYGIAYRTALAHLGA